MPARTDIKNRIVAVIQAASSVAGSRVYVGRHNVLPSAATGFPAVYVYMLREDVETIVMGASRRRQQRAMTLAVDYWCKAANPDATEDLMDTACGLIEAAINADTDLNGTAADVLLTNTEYLYDVTEEAPFGRAVMQWRVLYFSNET
jgi:hypothetical protein